MLKIVETIDDDKNKIYFIKHKDFIMDCSIASQLDIELEKYKKILKKFGAFLSSSDGQYYFYEKENCQKALEYLEDMYIIVMKLKGN